MTQCSKMVIRADNVQMISVLEQMEESLETGDTDTTLGTGETVFLAVTAAQYERGGNALPNGRSKLERLNSKLNSKNKKL